MSFRDCSMVKKVNSNRMNVDLKNAVSQLSSRTNVETVCCEALMNALHAGASEINLDFIEKIGHDGELELDDPNKAKLGQLKVSDNGEGFNTQNIKSFLELYSTHKEELGCKGVGRLAYLKVFESVNIISRSSEGNVSCDFDFSIHDSSFVNSNDDLLEGQGTVVNFSSPINKKSNEGIPLQFNKIIDGIFKNIMPHLYLEENSITIRFRHLNSKKVIDEYVIKSDDLPKLSEKKFTIQEFATKSKEKYQFTLSYVISQNASLSDKSSMEGYYCANRRSVYTFGDKRVGDSRILLQPIKGYKILFLLESTYLNRKADKERYVFDVDPTYCEADSPVSWTMINENLLEKVESILLSKFPTLEEDGEKLMEEVKSNNLHLASYVEPLNKIGGIYSKKYYIDKAESKYKKDKEDFVKNKDQWRPEKVIRKASDLAGKELIEYIQMRDHIITQLETFQDEQVLEDEVHKLIIDMKAIANNDDVFSLEKNNLWLIDDKFMGFSEVASDVEINKILEFAQPSEGSDLSGNRRPDIAAFYRDKDRTKLVLFELKKITAGTYDASKGIDQLGLYAHKFQSHGVKEIYLYLLSEVDQESEIILKNRGFETIFSKSGKYMFGVLHNIACSVAILNPQAVISDARARNQTFIDLVRKGL